MIIESLYVPGIVLDNKDTTVNKTDQILHTLFLFQQGKRDDKQEQINANRNTAESGKCYEVRKME